VYGCVSSADSLLRAQCTQEEAAKGAIPLNLPQSNASLCVVRMCSTRPPHKARRARRRPPRVGARRGAQRSRVLPSINAPPNHKSHSHKTCARKKTNNQKIARPQNIVDQYHQQNHHHQNTTTRTTLARVVSKKTLCVVFQRSTPFSSPR
jgi:hypothetical protein